jgi:hypothetical protein
MSKQKKIDRYFQLSDSSLNVYGFRLMTNGYQIEEYRKNPIGYYMHDRNAGVILKWEDLKIEDDVIKGKPVINLSHPKGQQIVDEIENGFLNAASVGHIVALEYSDDENMKLPGQYGPTLTKWYNRECSLVDVPGNMNSLALYDKDGNQIQLSDFTNQNKIMKQIFLTPEQLTKLGLKADADTALVNTTIENLVAEAGKVPQLTQDLAAARADKKTADDNLAAFKKTTTVSNVNAMVDKAVEETRCTKEAGEQFKKLFADKPEELKALLATMQPYTPITGQLNAGNAATSETAEELKNLTAMKADELFAGDGAERLKVLNLAAFKVKYKQYTGEEYKETKGE